MGGQSVISEANELLLLRTNQPALTFSLDGLIMVLRKFSEHAAMLKRTRRHLMAKLPYGARICLSCQHFAHGVNQYFRTSE